MTSCLASRRLLSALRLCALLILFVFNSRAFGEIKIQTVTGASRYDEGASTPTSATPSPSPTPTTTYAPKIYGGVAGSCVTVNTDGTCDSCPAVAFNGNLANSCNKNRIQATSTLTITYTSAKTGYAVITKSDDKTQKIYNSTTLVTAGQTVTLAVPWTTICNAIGANNCAVTSPAAVSANLLIGVTDSATGDLSNAATVEYLSVSFTVSDVMSGLSGASHSYAASDCNSETNSSVCDWSIQSGDSGASLKNLGKHGNFPTLAGTIVRAIRVYVAECTFDVSSAGALGGQFNAIKEDSNNYVDLPVTTDANGNPTLVQNRIKGLTNGKTYCMKIGLVDDAMNVGLFTPAGGDTTCTLNYLKDPNNGGADYAVGTCHVARPDEVLGVLAENCFIATAAYGSPFSLKVQTFRDFRNKFLLTNKLGKEFVKFYYAHSPALAHKIARSEAARAITRAALSPIWLFARISLRIGILATLFLTFAILATPFAFVFHKQKNRRDRKRVL